MACESSSFRVVGRRCGTCRVENRPLARPYGRACLIDKSGCEPCRLRLSRADRRIGFLNSEFARWFALGVADVSEAPGHPMKEVFAEENLPGVSKELVAAFAGEQQRRGVVSR
jgi:hypothetical protein